MSDISLDNWQKQSEEHHKKYKQLLEKAKTNKVANKHVLNNQQTLHEEAFEKIDCLSCAACCKNYSPRFKPPDIKRISKHLRMRETDFIETYLRMDDEGDYVVHSTPCPFLGEDNYCGIYDVRPSDCERFPYTDEDVLFKKPLITLKNASFCPIVYYVLENLIAEV